MREPNAAESKAVQPFRSEVRRTLIAAIVVVAGLWHLGHPGIAAASWALQGNQISDPCCNEMVGTVARAAVMESSGDIVIVWKNNLDVWIQRITADGVPAPGWPAGGKLITTGADSQHYPEVVRDWSNGVYVAWAEREDDNNFIRLQRILPDGTRAPGWPARGLAVVDELNDANVPNRSPRLVSDFPGTRVFVVWNHRISSDNGVIRAQQVDSDGHLMWAWAEDGIVVSDIPVAVNPDESLMTAVGDQRIGFYIAWESAVQIVNEEVWVQHMAENGIPYPGWSPSGIRVSSGGGSQQKPGLAADGLGYPGVADGAHVFWEDTRFGTVPARLFGTHLHSHGAQYDGYPVDGKEFGHFLNTSNNASLTAVAGDRNGGAFVGWEADFDSSFVMAIDANGSPRWNPPRRAIQTNGNATTGATRYLSLDNDTEILPPFQPAGVYATWLDVHGSSSSQVRAQHFSPIGDRALPTAGAVLRYHSPDQNPHNHQVLSLGSGNAVAIYEGYVLDDPDRTAVFANLVHGASNLSYAGSPPNGWSDYGVPSSAPNGTEQSAEISDQLNGNDPSTWVSMSFANDGPYATPPSVRRLSLDEETTLFELPAVQDLEVGTELHPAEGAFSIRGGRHSLALNADASNDVPESNEDDNLWQTQFVWSPLFLSVGVGEERTFPPSPIFPLPNADGFAFTRPPLYAWVAALAPQTPGDDYDLHVYDDYQGSQSGYSNLRALSLYGGNSTDFVVGHYNGTPTTLYPAAVRYAIGGGGQNFYIDQQNAEGRNAGGTGSFRGQQLIIRRLADVYEANLTAGSSYHFRVLRTTGNDDLALRIFPAVPGGIYAPYESAGESFPSSPDADELYFTATATDWYPLVVYRTDGTEAQGFLAYDLTWEPSSTGLPELPPTTPPATPLALAFLPPAPNPTHGPATLAFDLPSAGAVRIDVFDVAGRHVRRLVDRTLAGGRQEVLWDGKDAEGHRAPRGTYLLRLTSPSGEQLTRRVQLLR